MPVRKICPALKSEKSEASHQAFVPESLGLAVKALTGEDRYRPLWELSSCRKALERLKAAVTS